MAAGFGGSGPESGDGSADVPISGTRAQRYQVVLHVEEVTLSADGEPARSELEDGTRLSAESARRLACDASVVRVLHGRDGSNLDVGRRTRTISPALRRALEVRDRGCRFPGCGLRFTTVWSTRADGGWRGGELDGRCSSIPAVTSTTTAGGSRPRFLSNRWKR